MYSLAQRHYLRSNQPREFASMLVAWANQGYASEKDLYIARSVLMYVVCCLLFVVCCLLCVLSVLSVLSVSL